MARARISAVLPAASGTTSVTGWVGNSAASAPSDRTLASSAIHNTFFMHFPLFVVGRHRRIGWHACKAGYPKVCA
ncbi:hypothetical protein L571_2198 [Bordetella pertussis 2371640]|nr:hypothetical protein L571_2198 [Bordetella pertussis 2371640]